MPAGNSPTMAPTTLAVAAIRNAVNRYGGDGRQAQLREDRPPAGRIGAHQLEGPRVGRAHAAQRGDRDREERQVGRHDRDAEPARLEPDDDDRGDGDDRHGLAGDEERHQAALEDADVDQDDREPEPDRHAEEEAEHRLAEREEPGADERREVGLARRVEPEERRDDRREVGQVEVVDRLPAERRVPERRASPDRHGSPARSLASSQVIRMKTMTPRNPRTGRARREVLIRRSGSFVLAGPIVAEPPPVAGAVAGPRNARTSTIECRRRAPTSGCGRLPG